MFKTIGYLKGYFMGASHYLGIINFVLILGTFKQLYEINLSLYLIAPTGLILILIIGWIDYKLVQPHTIRQQNNINEMWKKLEKIEEKIK